jgi:hypothetical protein
MAYGSVKVDTIIFDNGGSDQNVTVSGLYRATTSGVTVTGTISGAVLVGTTTVSGATVTGNVIQGTIVQGISGTFTSLTGTTTTGTTANFASGVFTTRVSGTIITGDTGQFTSGTFVSLTGTTITGTTINAVTVSSTTGTFTSLTGDTINGVTVAATTGSFTSLTGTTTSGTTANFVSGVFTTQVFGTTVTGTTSNFTSGNFATLSGATATFTSGVIASGTATNPSLSFVGDPNTGIYSPGADQLAVATNGVERVEFGATEVVFNDDGADVDFRIEGDTNANLFKIDAGLDEVQVANLNGGPLAGFRNRIINGNFDFWQRGTSFTGNEYGADRWFHNRVGTTHTVTRQPFTLGQTDVPNEPTYYCRTVVSSVAGAGNYAVLFQRIEDVRTFAGQQVTVSFWAKVDSTKNIAVELFQDFGTGGSPSAEVTTIGTTKVSIGTSWQQVTVTATVPSISGKTLGTDNNSNLNLIIWFDAGSDFNARTDSLGQQSGTFEIAQVQIEPGSVATPFEQRPIGAELALCQRYYQHAILAQVGGVTSSGIGLYSAVQLPVRMRVGPTLTQRTLNLVGSCTSLNIAGTTVDYIDFNASNTSGGSGIATAVYSASAEL